VFYDPRGLAINKKARAIWHAKCALIDDELAFVSSANFTKPGHTHNVEAGVIIRDSHFTGQLRAQFDGLVHAKQVARLPGF
jgi:phosphatidylserine/phosphatidylglycerophosphate/cardiolipin synthase-like enzyme